MAASSDANRSFTTRCYGAAPPTQRDVGCGATASVADAHAHAIVELVSSLDVEAYLRSGGLTEPQLMRLRNRLVE